MSEYAYTNVRRRRRSQLPHLEAERGLYFVTFNLADAVLPEFLDEQRRKREQALRAVAALPTELRAEQIEAIEQNFRKLVQEHLDSGQGHCYLGIPEIAELTQSALLHFNGIRHRLIAWCVMPNHVHCVFRQVDGWSLDRVMHSWKSFTANRANRILRRSGTFWQQDYFDVLIRSPRQLAATVRYVLENPDRASLPNWQWRGCDAIAFAELGPSLG